jgi:methylglutaconyl-CoA hydratase
VALVEGGGFGGGAGLAAACDMVVAVKNAKFAFSEVKLGLIAATVSPYVVAAVDTESARLFGLVDEIVDDVAALEAAKARIIGTQRLCAPGAVAESKKLVAEVAGRPIDHGLMVHTAKRIAAQRVGDEGQAGVRAFLDGKQAPWAE